MKNIIGILVLLVTAFVAGSFVGGSKVRSRGVEMADRGAIECASSTGTTVEMSTTKLYFEYNSTDKDTGVHGGFDTTSFAELCVYDPTGKQILAIKPQNQLKELTMAGIFFESREPHHKEITQQEHFAMFPEGKYLIRGVDFEGNQLVGAATLSHAVPAAPKIMSPGKDEKLSRDGAVVTWEPVAASTLGTPITVTGYEVIITKEVEDDQHGYSRPTYDVHVVPSVTSLHVPAEFFEPNSKYELEVLALETSGNQTISVSFFETLE